MQRIVILDGHNLIHKDKALLSMYSINKEGAAKSIYEKFRRKLTNNQKLILVLDGFGSSEQGIIYSGNITADEVIRKYVEENHTKKSILVVSSDNLILNLAKACGCDTALSENYVKENFSSKSVKQTDLNDKSSSEKPDRITKKELNEFKKLFE